MPTLESLTEADLRGPLNTKSLGRARGYVRQVQNPVRCGQTLTAQVRGTYLYEVEVDVEPTGIIARCSCPYNWGGYCKHIGALLLRWIQSPGSFTIREATPSSSEYPIEVTPVDPPPTHRPEEYPFWLTMSFIDRQRADDQQLSRWLERIKLQDLRLMAKKRDWKVRGTRKADVVQQIFEHITDPGGILKAVLSLDEEHRQVLCALVLLGDEPSVQADDLARVAMAWGELTSHERLETFTRHLCEMGFAMPGDVIDAYSPRSDFIPRAIIRRLSPILDQGICSCRIANPAGAVEDLRPSPESPSDQSASELGFGDPYELVRIVSQITLLLEEGSLLPSPPALRPPMPRPRLEKFYPGLEKWDYDPDEILQAKEKGKLSPHLDLVLTVPPPRYSLPDETIERLAPVAGGETRLEFIFSLLVAAGIFQPGSPVTIWPEVKELFLRQDELTQRAILARVYFQMSNWSALWELLRHHPTAQSPNHLTLKRVFSRRYFKPEQLRADLVGFRQLVLRALASLPDGKWVALEDLFRLMRIVWPRFDQTVWQTFRFPQSTGSWFLAEAGSETPLSPANAEHWQLAQGNFIRTIITGPLHWLGLADLSFSDGELAAVRFHGLADLYWDRVETPPAPRHTAAHAQPTSPEEVVRTDHHTISVHPSTTSAQAHNLLDKMARLETATADLFVYQLDPQAAYEAFEAGAALSEILDDWEQLMPVPMPEAIRAQLTDWWEAYGRVRIYEDLTVIEFSDDYALAEMKAVTSLEEHLIAEVSPRLVVVPQKAVTPLVAELEKAGYTPKQTDEV